MLDVIPLTDFKPEAVLTANELILFSELVSGQRVVEAGVVTLQTEEWLERWKSFAERRADYMAVDWPDSDIAAWHRRQIEACARARHWQFGRQWHTDRLDSMRVDEAVEVPPQ